MLPSLRNPVACGCALSLLLPASAESLVYVGILPGRGFTYDVAVAGDVVYVADFSGGLQTVDVSDPTSPRELGSLTLPGPVVDVEVAGSTAYLAAASGGLHIVDVSDPLSPAALGALVPEGGEVRDVAVEGNVVYLADGQFGLRIVDVSAPSSPVEIAALGLSGFPLDVEVVGDTAYVAAGSGGLYLVDVSDPNAPVELHRVSAGGFIDTVEVLDGLAYIGDANHLRILNVSDPAAPEEIGAVETSGNGSVADLELAGGLAYVATSDAGLVVVDVSDPRAPVASGTLFVRYGASDVEVSGGIAYLAAGDLGVIDTTNPDFPVQVGKIGTSGYSENVTVVDGVAYVGDACRVRIIDITEPRLPKALGSFRFGRDCAGLRERSPTESRTWRWNRAFGSWTFRSRRDRRRSPISPSIPRTSKPQAHEPTPLPPMGSRCSTSRIQRSRCASVPRVDSPSRGTSPSWDRSPTWPTTSASA